MSRQFILPFFLIIILAACSGPGAGETAAGFDTPIPNQVEIHEETGHDGHKHVHLDPSQVTTNMEVTLVASELVVGPNRFAVGLFDGRGKMVQEATVHLHYYDLSQPDTPVLEVEADATPIHTPDGYTTIFAHEREFKRAGPWGVEVQARFPDGAAAIKRIGFGCAGRFAHPETRPDRAGPGYAYGGRRE